MNTKDNFPKPIISEPFEEPSVISNVVEYLSNYITVKKVDEPDADKIVQWARFVRCDNNDSKYETDSRNVIFLLGMKTGLQIYQLRTDGFIVLIYSLKNICTYTASILPSPFGNTDEFSDHRPLLACSVETIIKFYSLKSGNCVKEIGYEKPILQIDGTDRIIAAVSHLDLVLICSKRLVVICRLTNCMAASDPSYTVPYSLSDHWLAFADNRLSRDILSFGGDISESNSIPYAVTLLSMKKMVVSNFGSGDVAKDSTSEEKETGIATIINLDLLLDLFSNSNSKELNSHFHPHLVVAHFVAHLWTQISKMSFDATGTLLLTACSKGLFCHLFRIASHPSNSKQTAVLHLYRLKRGDTPCSIISLAISKDGRLAAASSNHGTIHIWPISSYGGQLCVRTHCQKHVVNRLSRLERSAGLQEHQVTRPRASSCSSFLESSPNHAYHSLCPRLPPMPIPCTLNSYVQLKPVAHIPSTDRPLVLVPIFPHEEYNFSIEHYVRSEPVLVLTFDGRLIQYILHHRPDSQHQTSSRVELDAPFFIEKQPMNHWKLLISDISNFVDKDIFSKRRVPQNSKIITPIKLSSQPALLKSVIPDFLNHSLQANPSTPKCWYSHIEISSQINSTCNIRRQEKFTISTYHTKELSEARLEVLEKSPSTSSDLSIQSGQGEIEKLDLSKDYLSSQPVRVPFSEQRIQICNSFCGSSVSDSLNGSIDNMCSVLAHAIQDEDDYSEPSQEIIEEPKTGYIEFMTRDIGHVRLRRVSGSFSSENGRMIGFSTSPVEEDIHEELDIPMSSLNKQSKQSKRYDKKKGRRN